MYSEKEINRVYDKVHKFFDGAQKQLEKTIGRPVCDHCGKCCEVQEIVVGGYEAKYIASWVRKQKPEVYDKIFNACENWLMTDHKITPPSGEDFSLIRAGMGTYLLTPEAMDRLGLELEWIMRKTGCPFLEGGNKCLIYPVRPLVCAAWGVTRIAGKPPCERESGKTEFKDYRAYIDGKWKTVIEGELGKLIMDKAAIVEHACILPTILYLELNPQGFMNHLYHNEIASAKLGQAYQDLTALFQEDVIRHQESENEIRLLCNPIPIAPEDVKPFSEFEKENEKEEVAPKI